MNRVLLCTVIGFLVLGASLGAQSNELIDALLAESQASYGRAAFLALAGAGLVKADATPLDALAALAERGWAVQGRAAEAPMTTGEYALLLMRAFQIKGGLMYRLFPGPRYATRELSYEKLLGPKAAPGDALKGEDAVRLAGELAERKGGRS